MSGGGKNGSNQPRYSPTKAPDPVSEYFSVGGNPTSSRVYDPTTKAYTTNVNLTSDQKAIQDNAYGFLSGLSKDASQAFDMSPEAIKSYSDAYKQPQIQALDDSYNKAIGNYDRAGATTGGRNSLGFARMLANEIEQPRAQGMADIEANTKMLETQLPAMQLQPYSQAANMFTSLLSGEQANNMANVNPSFQGSQASNAFNQANYANQLGSYNNYYNQQMAANPQSQGGGFNWSKMLFGF